MAFESGSAQRGVAPGGGGLGGEGTAALWLSPPPLVVCPRNDLAVARMWTNGSSNGDSGPNRRNAPDIKRQLVQETHHLVPQSPANG